MASKYSIIQFLPDPIIDERINVGVVAFDTAIVYLGFLHNWNRVKAFSGEEAEFFPPLFEHYRQSIASKIFLPDGDNSLIAVSKRFEETFCRFINTVQFTTPRASLQSVDELFIWCCDRFLVQPKKVQ